MFYKSLLTGLFAVLLFQFVNSQNLLTQTVRGTIIDADNQQPVAGATVVVLYSDPARGTISAADGSFRIPDVPLGRIDVKIAALGYQDAILTNIVVNAGKEVVMNVSMEATPAALREVTISQIADPGQAINDMALLSARSISPEQTNRYAGGFNDPSRILSNFAGVTNTQDGSNDIIVRGNAPKYVQWRLEGVEITNPNHFGDQSSAGGSISTLNNNIIATSDFYTGAFAPEFGDALSAVYDLKLRTGNNEHCESVFSLGLLGADLAVEGPFKRGYGGSFLLNYRYSTAGMANDLGLIEGANALRFQDAAFKIVLPAGKAGIFSLFGLGGHSSFLLEDVTPSFWETPGHTGMRSEIREDYQKSAFLANSGLNHTVSLGDKSYLRTTLAFSREGIDDDVYLLQLLKLYDDKGVFLRDSFLSRNLNFNSRLQKTIYRAAVTYNLKLSARHKLQAGSRYSNFGYQYSQSQLKENSEERQVLTDFDENIGTLRNFFAIRSRITKKITVVTGLHNMNVLFNKKYTLEPRFAFQWAIAPDATLHAGYGSHSTMESVHNYFAKIETPAGNITEPNRDLDLLKARHFVAGIEKQCGRYFTAKLEVYYQYLYNLPVENLDTSFYATINEGLEFRYVDLVNRGTGRNYGVEVTLERHFHRDFYFLLNATLYESVYKSLEGVERNTPFNSKYLVNFLCGKEFNGLGKKKNRTLALNGKVLFAGGRRIIPLLRDPAGNLTVDPANNQFWDYEKAFVPKLDDIYQIILSVSYKWQKPRATHEVFMNLDNITHHKGRITEFYDESEPGSVGYLTQFGFFPNLLYRVYF